MTQECTKCILTVRIANHPEIIRPQELPRGVKYYAAQNEKGTLTGYDHYQVVIFAFKPHAYMWFQSIVSKCIATGRGTRNSKTKAQNLSANVHVKPVYVDNGVAEYPLKEDTYMNDGSRRMFGDPSHGNKSKTEEFADRIQAAKTYDDFLRVEGVHTHFAWARAVWMVRPKAPILVKEKAYPWQNHVLRLAHGHLPTEDRMIYFVVDGQGNSGKSQCAKFMMSMFGALVITIIAGNSERDLASIYNGEGVVVFDVARTVPVSQYALGFMENLKDGHITSGKYESNTKVFNPPFIIVFTNSMHNFKSLLTWDRAQVIILTPPIVDAPVANLTGQAGGAIGTGMVSRAKPWPDFTYTDGKGQAVHWAAALETLEPGGEWSKELEPVFKPEEVETPDDEVEILDLSQISEVDFLPTGMLEEEEEETKEEGPLQEEKEGEDEVTVVACSLPDRELDVPFSPPAGTQVRRRFDWTQEGSFDLSSESAKRLCEDLTVDTDQVVDSESDHCESDFE